MKPQTYVRKFSTGGLCATFTFYPDRLIAGDVGGLVCNWNRVPTKEQAAELMPEYLAWRTECFQAIANETGYRVMGFIQTAPHEGWAADFTPEAKI